MVFCQMYSGKTKVSNLEWDTNLHVPTGKRIVAGVGTSLVSIFGANRIGFYRNESSTGSPYCGLYKYGSQPESCNIYMEGGLFLWNWTTHMLEESIVPKV